jgi:hypothetical protein
MVGLGVLRKSGPDRWALRSANVLNLLGTHKDIEEALARAISAEPPPPYDHLSFRRADASDPMRRSPLTGMQESRLAQRESGAAIVFGSRAAGILSLAKFLEPTLGLSVVQEPPGRLEDWEGLRQWLQTLLTERARPVFAVVDESHPWIRTGSARAAASSTSTARGTERSG